VKTARTGYPAEDVERVAKALFLSRPLKVEGAAPWSRMSVESKQAWYALAIASLDMTYGVQARI
jgi:hypothetical protein